MGMNNFNRLKNIIGNFKNAKVLVIGDLILDEFIWGEVSRISPEAPVPVVWVKRESFMPGGASNVANNLSSLGAHTYLAGVIGSDERGAILKGELEQKNIDVSAIVSDPSRPTTLKTRVVAHHQQVVRIDKEKVGGLSDDMVRRIINNAKSIIEKVDAVIIEDYGKGVITPKLLKEIVPFAKARRKIISVDPKEEHLMYYKGITLITPNNYEASKAVGFEIKDAATLKKAGQVMLKKFKCKIALITLGENGMAVFEKDKPSMSRAPAIR
jgi:rfaE bifunctional protein kinase chain/domain